MKREKIGLALGSGGVKGLAHIGVIKELEKNKTPIDYIAGSSIGALVGALYAYTKDINQVEEFFLKNSNWHTGVSLLDLGSKSGLFQGKKLKKFLDDYFDGITFDQLKLPLAIVATNIDNGKEVILNSGRVVDAVMASISAPPVFQPIIYKDMLLSDGGMTNPVPCTVARAMGADIVIGVNLENGYFNPLPGKKFGISEMVTRSLGILRAGLAKISVKEASIIVSPNTNNDVFVGLTEFFDKKNITSIIKDGEVALQKELMSIKKLLEEKPDA